LFFPGNSTGMAEVPGEQAGQGSGPGWCRTVDEAGSGMAAMTLRVGPEIWC